MWEAWPMLRSKSDQKGPDNNEWPEILVCVMTFYL